MKGSRSMGAAGAALAALSLCWAASFWIANGVAPWSNDRANLWHHYEYLADGFLSGHTYLSLSPAPELARLADPFDPSANAAYRLWDASLYNGKYYLYYGPTPAVALMAPWRAVTGSALPQRAAVAIFACLAMAALGRLAWEIRRRHLPSLSGPALAGILIVAFHVSWLPVTLRRPGVWELPIVAGEACLWASLYFLWKFHDSGGKAGWAAATGIALGLLMGSRATQVLAAAAILLLLLVPTAAGGSRRWRAALVAAAISCAAGLALLLYNHARFGRWLEFGQSYQLWGIDERRVRHFDPSFVFFNARLYLTSIPYLSPYFPFLKGSWPSDTPAGYIATEEIQGILFVMPVHLAGLAALAWAWGGRKPGPRSAAVVLAGAAAASAIAGAVLFCWAGACSRYMTELLGGWTIATTAGLMVVFARAGGAKTPLRLLAGAASVWSVAGVWMSSAEFRGFMRLTEPRLYAAVARAADYPSFWWIRSAHARFGPIDLDIRVPATPAPETVLMASGRPQMQNQLILVPASGGQVRLVLSENQHVTLETPPLAIDHGALRVRVEAPWLYPPRESPYWDAVADPAARFERQTRFAVSTAAGETLVHSGSSFDPIGFLPAVRSRAGPEAGTPFVASASQPAARP